MGDVGHADQDTERAGTEMQNEQVMQWWWSLEDQGLLPLWDWKLLNKDPIFLSTQVCSSHATLYSR